MDTLPYFRTWDRPQFDHFPCRFQWYPNSLRLVDLASCIVCILKWLISFVDSFIFWQPIKIWGIFCLIHA